MKKHTKKETENVEVLETPIEETEVIEEEATEKKFSMKKALPWIVGGVTALLGGAVLAFFGRHSDVEELYPVDDSYDYGSDEDDEASTDEDPDGDAPSEDSEE